MQHKIIPSNANFKDVAQDIVNNMEAWRVDSQAKTEVALTKMIANRNKKASERAKYLASRTGEMIENNRGYGLGHGRQTGD